MESILKSVEGKILRIDKETGEITIKVGQDDLAAFIGKNKTNCNIQLLGGKTISKKQRKFCYAMLNDIAEWAGMRLEESKRIMKDKFLEDYVGDFDLEDFSLKDAPMELINDFQDFLIDFILSYDVPTKQDIKGSISTDKYMYMCIKNRKCCVCGKDGSSYTDHDGTTISVCGSHRIELLTSGASFYEKYHVDPIFYSAEQF